MKVQKKNTADKIQSVFWFPEDEQDADLVIHHFDIINAKNKNMTTFVYIYQMHYGL